MSHLLSQVANLDSPNVTAVSPWSIPIPVGECAKSPVVIYFYSDNWIPIAGFSLGEAIALYHKALFLGKKILVYPPNLALCTQNLNDKSIEVTLGIHKLFKFSEA